MANLTATTTYNVGFGGTRMAVHSLEPFNAFSMYNLADSIANRDWTLQDKAMAQTDWTPPGLYARTLKRLKSIDFNKVDIITLSFGTNDFTGKILPSSADMYNTSTYAGALRYSIETIKAAYPHIEIVLCTPIYRFWIDDNNEYLYDSNTYEIRGSKLTDFVQTVKDISRTYGLLCIDNYYDSSICYENRLECFPETDGTHPNIVGRQMIAENMARELYKYFG